MYKAQPKIWKNKIFTQIRSTKLYKILKLSDIEINAIPSWKTDELIDALNNGFDDYSDEDFDDFN